MIRTRTAAIIRRINSVLVGGQRTNRSAIAGRGETGERGLQAHPLPSRPRRMAAPGFSRRKVASAPVGEMISATVKPEGDQEAAFPHVPIRDCEQSPVAKPTRESCRTSKFRVRHVLPGSAPAFAASATNSFRRGPHAATADTDPKNRPNFRARGRSWSAPAFGPCRARWHSASARKVTNRKECPGPGFRDRNMISVRTGIGGTFTKWLHHWGFFVSQDFRIPGTARPSGTGSATVDRRCCEARPGNRVSPDVDAPPHSGFPHRVSIRSGRSRSSCNFREQIRGRKCGRSADNPPARAASRHQKPR
jgi:hypothetical protein